MLISLDRRFIFIANIKSASTAIEKTLKPLCDIAIVEAPFGKHLPFSSVEHLFSWVFGLVPREAFTIFGVMRDPVDFMLSLYNSHTPRMLRIALPHLYTGSMDFDRFLREWCERNSDQLMPQYSRFLDQHGAVAANYVISYDQLRLGLRHVASRIGAPELLTMPRVNASDQRLRRRDLTQHQVAWIAQHFAEDRRFIEGFCNRPLTRADQQAWRSSLAA